MKHRTLAAVGFVICAGTTTAVHATTVSANISNELRDRAATDEAALLLERADEVLNSIEYTIYSASDVWDVDDGEYKVVCAGYLNHLLDEALPEHYDDLRDEYGDLGVWDYYDFFRSIPYGETRRDWKRIERVADLRPGDVVVWKYSEESTSPRWGHVLIVASVPTRDLRWSNAWKLRVTDAASSPHSNDNRIGSSGVGAGEMLLKAGSTTGRPIRFAWSLLGIWRSDVDSIVMARPTE
jgi:hypothetical protein